MGDRSTKNWFEKVLRRSRFYSIISAIVGAKETQWYKVDFIEIF